jgi:hypothetical protein
MLRPISINYSVCIAIVNYCIVYFYCLLYVPFFLFNKG